MRSLGPMLLLTACICGVAIAARWIQRPIDISPIIAEASPTDQAVASTGTLLTKPDLPVPAFSQIVTRPLFSRDRRKFTPPARPPKPSRPVAAVRTPASASKIVEAKPNLRLLGVSIGNRRSMILLARASAEPSWTTLGAAVDGWIVQKIDANGAVIANGDQTFRLDLYGPAGEKTRIADH